MGCPASKAFHAPDVSTATSGLETTANSASMISARIIAAATAAELCWIATDLTSLKSARR